VIAGTALKCNGLISAPVDPERVSALKRLLPQSAQIKPLP
jgi:predicted TIM-barrel enzyme